MQDQFNYLLVSSEPVITGIIESDINQPRRPEHQGQSPDMCTSVSFSEMSVKGEASGIQMTTMTRVESESVDR